MHVDEERTAGDHRQYVGAAAARARLSVGALARAVPPHERDRRGARDKTSGRRGGGLDGWKRDRGDPLDRADLGEDR